MNIIEKAIKKEESIISEYGAKKILSYYDIPVVKEKLAKSSREAVKWAKKIGYPVVLKGFSSTLVHKSEYGIIELNLKNENEVNDAWNKINSKKINLEGVLVQKQIVADIELIVGIKRDPTFGSCIIFGLGGIFTEALGDISIRVAPLDKIEAEEMIKEIKGYKVLKGWRGKKEVNIDLLSDILVKVSKISEDYPQIQELDINPLLVQDGVPVVTDALIVLEKK